MDPVSPDPGGPAKPTPSKASAMVNVWGDDIIINESESKETDQSSSQDAVEELPTPDVVTIPRDVLIAAALSWRAEFEKNREKKIKVKCFSQPHGDDKSSSLPLSALKPVTLSQLQLDVRPKGYLLCRIIAPASRRVCVQLVVEDVEGAAQLLSLYNHPGTQIASPAELDTLFPIGMIVAVRAPLIKRAVTGRRRTHLRVDNPADIILVKPTDELLSVVSWKTGKKPDGLISRTADEWKSQGDTHFKAGEPFAAAVAYTRCLILDSSKYKARMNRSLCHIRLGNTQAALQDTECLLDNPSLTQAERTKSLLRKGTVLYNDMKYEDTRTIFLECLELDPQWGEATQYLEQCLQRLQERDLGQYDWVHLFEQAMKPGSRLDVSDFRGPMEMRDIDNLKGRAVFATKPIKAGQLLVVEKAFVSAFPEDLRAGYNNLVSEDADISTGLIYLRQKCTTKLAFNPHLQPQFSKLFAGNTPEILGAVQTEAFSADSIAAKAISTNVISDIETFSLPYQPDIQRTHRITSINSCMTWFPGEATFDFSHDPSHFGRAIFLFSSGFANECYANTYWECWGDVIIVRASQDIARGKEIKISYGPPARYAARYKEVVDLFACTKGLHYCPCNICRDARFERGVEGIDPEVLIFPHLRRFDTPSREAICVLMEELESEPSVIQAKVVAQMALLLEKSHQGRPEPSIQGPERAFATFRLTMTLRRFILDEIRSTKPIHSLIPRIDNVNRMITAALDTLHCLGLELLNKNLADNNWSAMKRRENPNWIPLNTKKLPFSDCGVICLVLAEAWHIVGAMAMVDDWMRAAIWLEDTTRGGGIPLFKIRYAKLLKELGPFAAKSLSRVEKGEPAPTLPFEGPSVLGKVYYDQLHQALDSLQGL